MIAEEGWMCKATFPAGQRRETMSAMMRFGWFRKPEPDPDHSVEDEIEIIERL